MSANKPLARRVILVTGGSRGIGEAICRTLDGAGATLALCYRNDTQAAARVLADLSDTSTMWQADITDHDASARMIDAVVDQYGRLDGVILNAGVWRADRIDRLSPSDWRLVLDTSLHGAFGILRRAVPAMRAARWGRVVAVSSSVALTGFPGDAAYASAKAGLLGMVRALAHELGADGITVNAVAPGVIRTDMTAAVPSPSLERIASRTPLGRLGSLTDVAAAVRYLLCDGGYVTGHTLVVDGGYSL